MNSVSPYHFTNPCFHQKIFKSSIPEIWEIVLNHLLLCGNTLGVVQFARTCQEARNMVVKFLNTYKEGKYRFFTTLDSLPCMTASTESEKVWKRIRFAGKDQTGRFYFCTQYYHGLEGHVRATGMVMIHTREDKQLYPHLPRKYLKNKELKSSDVSVQAVVPFSGGGVCYLTSHGIFLWNADGHHVIPCPTDTKKIWIKGYAQFGKTLFFANFLDRSASEEGNLQLYELDLHASKPKLVHSKRLFDLFEELLPRTYHRFVRESPLTGFSFYSSGNTLFVTTEMRILEVSFQEGEFKKSAEYRIPHTFNPFSVPSPLNVWDIKYRANHAWFACAKDGGQADNYSGLVVFNRKEGLDLWLDLRAFFNKTNYFELQDDFLFAAEENQLAVIHLPTRQMYKHDFLKGTQIVHAWLDFHFHDQTLVLNALVLNSEDPMKEDWAFDKCYFQTFTFSEGMAPEEESQFEKFELGAPVFEETFEKDTDYTYLYEKNSEDPSNSPNSSEESYEEKTFHGSFPKKSITIEKVTLAIGTFFLLASLAAFTALLITHTGTFIHTSLPVLLGGGIPSLLAIGIASIRMQLV